MTQELTAQESIDRLFDWRLSRLNTAIPAEVIKYDSARQTVDVRVHFTENIETDAGVEQHKWPELSDVPVVFTRSSDGSASITVPIKSGDLVLLVFAQRSIDEWFDTDGKRDVTPRDLRMHDASDAFAIPGIGTGKRVLPGPAVDPDSIVIRANNSRVIVKPDGTVVIEAGITEIGAIGASTPVVVDKTINGLGSYLGNNTTLVNAMGGILGLIPST